MTSRYDIATIKKQLAAAEQHDKKIYGEKVRKLLLEKTNLDSLKDVLHDYDIIVKPKKSKEKPSNQSNEAKMAEQSKGAGSTSQEQAVSMTDALDGNGNSVVNDEEWVSDDEDEVDDDDDYIDEVQDNDNFDWGMGEQDNNN